MEIIEVNGVNYEITMLLGHGKGGYSYLAKNLLKGTLVVIKKIHHEPCDYYKFSNKIASELHDYERLVKTGIRIPKLLDYDLEKEIIVKEYIDGPTIDELVIKDECIDLYISQVEEMAEMCKRNNLNIDYFPTNFVVKDNLIYYIDYECNEYMDKWNYSNWGKLYWSKTKEFKEHFHLK